MSELRTYYIFLYSSQQLETLVTSGAKVIIMLPCCIDGKLDVLPFVRGFAYFNSGLVMTNIGCNKVYGMLTKVIIDRPISEVIKELILPIYTEVALDYVYCSCKSVKHVNVPKIVNIPIKTAIIEGECYSTQLEPFTMDEFERRVIDLFETAVKYGVNVYAPTEPEPVKIQPEMLSDVRELVKRADYIRPRRIVFVR